ncbi:MAG: HAD-IA family hydrolase [Propionibacteriaceae bacterium]|nr:HAD-IA family hydrolase [Propionibacteriaceae bacterium]
MWIISGDVGYRKPDPRIYECLIEQANCRPDEIWFFDDRPLNIKVAHHLGLNATVFTSATQVREVLQATV